MSATTDVILAAGPTVVAVAALWLRTVEQKRGFSHEREMTDLAAVRSLLDDSALALHRAQAEFANLPAEPESAIERAEAILGDELEPLRQSLTVRFGPHHAVVAAFSEGVASVFEWIMSCARLSVPEQEGGPRADQRGTVEARRVAAEEKLAEATARFVEGAVRSAGAKLP